MPVSLVFFFGILDESAVVCVARVVRESLHTNNPPFTREPLAHTRTHLYEHLVWLCCVRRSWYLCFDIVCSLVPAFSTAGITLPIHRH